MHPSIHFLYPLNPVQGRGELEGLESIPTAMWQEAGYTLDKLPLYCLAKSLTIIQSLLNVAITIWQLVLVQLLYSYYFIISLA